MNSHKKGLMASADDLVWRMRQLAGSNDVDEASTIAKEALELLNDASTYDRQLSDDDPDSGVTLGYVLEMTGLVMDNIRGLPTSNRSRAAKDAKVAKAA